MGCIVQFQNKYRLIVSHSPLQNEITPEFHVCSLNVTATVWSIIISTNDWQAIQLEQKACRSRTAAISCQHVTEMNKACSVVATNIMHLSRKKSTNLGLCFNCAGAWRQLYISDIFPNNQWLVLRQLAGLRSLLTPCCLLQDKQCLTKLKLGLPLKLLEWPVQIVWCS